MEDSLTPGYPVPADITQCRPHKLYQEVSSRFNSLGFIIEQILLFRLIKINCYINLSCLTAVIQDCGSYYQALSSRNKDYAEQALKLFFKMDINPQVIAEAAVS